MTLDFELRLYVTAENEEVLNVVQKVRDLLKEKKTGLRLDTVNVLHNPEAAVQDGVLATPTLLRIYPEPTKRVLGDLSDVKKILALLDVLSD